MMKMLKASTDLVLSVRRRMRVGEGGEAKACHLLLFGNREHELHLDMPRQLKLMAEAINKGARSLPAWVVEWTSHSLKDRFAIEFRNKNQQLLIDWCLSNSCAMRYIQKGVRETVSAGEDYWTTLSLWATMFQVGGLQV
jgi:hypothetical protein